MKVYILKFGNQLFCKIAKQCNFAATRIIILKWNCKAQVKMINMN